MAITIDVNGQTINYPEIGDTNWADEATDFAVQTASAFGKLGLDIGITVDIPGTLDVTGNTTLNANLSVTGNATITGNLTANGNSNLGNASGDTIAVTGILNVDSGVLFVDPTTNKVGINDATPSVELDVNGAVAISGTLGVTGATTLSSTLGVTGDVAINTNKFNVTASSGNTTIAGTLGVAGNTTVDGIIYADDNTTANTPVISFTGDTNTGIGRSAADTLDFITNGNSRFRIESTGQIKAVYESQVGTDYNTQLDNGYLCRAWVNFNGTGTVAIRASGNVSSITDVNSGRYGINFLSSLPDIDYSVVGACSPEFGVSQEGSVTICSATATEVAPTVSRVDISCSKFGGAGVYDAKYVSVGVFR